MEELEKQINCELNQRKKELNLIMIIAIIFAIIYIFIFLNNLGKTFSFFVFIPAIISIVLFIIHNIQKNKLLKNLKRKVLHQILPMVFDDTRAIYIETGISKNEFEKSGIYKNYNEYFSSDGIKDYLNKFHISNVTVKKKSEETKTPVFIGVFGFCKTEEFFENEILIKPDVENKYVKNIIATKDKIIGDNRNVIRLENNEFERNFEVFSKDPLKARQVITTSYMEKLLKIKNDLNTSIKIVYKGDKKYIAIWNVRIIDEKNIYINGIDIIKIKNKIKKIYELVKI